MAKGICARGRCRLRLVSSVALLGSGGISRRLVMTKQGSFKRAVRQWARATDQRYAEARAVLEQAGD